jgi:hypothetical protein
MSRSMSAPSARREARFCARSARMGIKTSAPSAPEYSTLTLVSCWQERSSDWRGNDAEFEGDAPPRTPSSSDNLYTKSMVRGLSTAIPSYELTNTAYSSTMGSN